MSYGPRVIPTPCVNAFNHEDPRILRGSSSAGTEHAMDLRLIRLRRWHLAFGRPASAPLLRRPAVCVGCHRQILHVWAPALVHLQRSARTDRARRAIDRDAMHHGEGGIRMVAAGVVYLVRS